MIIATIGHKEFALKKLEDAEALLRILSEAISVETHYRLNGRVGIEENSHDFGIKIVSGELLSAEEARQLKAEYEKGRIKGGLPNEQA